MSPLGHVTPLSAHTLASLSAPREFADDIGAVKDDGCWPGRHIDWDAAADELKQDYAEVEFDGVSYWVR